MKCVFVYAVKEQNYSGLHREAANIFLLLLKYHTFFPSEKKSVQISYQNNENMFRFVISYCDSSFWDFLIGIINLNPPRPEAPDVQANLGNFSRVASGGSFVVVNIPCGGPRDVFPPSKITDLEVEPAEDDKFLLSWTAPGNDFDSGKGKCEILF